MNSVVPVRSGERTNRKSRRNAAAVLHTGSGRIEPLETRIALATVNLVFGTIPNGSVWLTGEIQRITADATLLAGSTLTIQPGAIIQFNEFIGADLIFDGTVNANGTAGTGRILFTAVRDETGLDGVLGTGDDVSIDGTPNTTGGNGDWGHIRFSSTSTATLNNIEVRFGGTSALNAEFVIESSNVSLSNSVIRNSSTSGVRITASNPTLATDSFQNNFQSAISMDLASNPAITAATATNNAFNSVTLDAGTLTGSRTWNDPSIVYRIAGDITVAAGATLTIGAGQIVKVRPFTGDDLLINGTLVADGAPGQPIIFTSDRDDTVGGDTNNNGATTGGNGDWNTITFGVTSTANLMDNVEVRYGGTGSTAAVVLNSAPLTLTNSIIRNSSTSGLRIAGSDPVISVITFQDNNASAITMDLASNPAISGVTMINNVANTLTLDPGILTGTRLWNDPDIVYRIAGDITVDVGATLTIGAGQIVKVRPFTGDDLFVNGTLIADGAPGQPIIITSDRDDTTGGDTNNNGATVGGNGDWNSITFGTNSTGNILDNVQVRFAGTGSAAAIILNGNVGLSLTNSIIRASNTNGLRIIGSDPTISAITFQDNFFSAVSMDLASNPSITGVTMMNNVINGLTLDNGTLTGNRTWNDPDIVYRLAGDITVAAGATLTIGAGQIVKVRPFTGDDLIVNGTLIADGTGTAPIILTSDRDDTAGGDTNNNGATTGGNGDWNTLTFGTGSTDHILDNVEVRFAGTGATAAVVLNANVGLSLTNSVIRSSNTAGLRIVDSDPTISGVTFQNNFGSAISMDLASDPDITAVTMGNNGFNCVTLDAGTLTGSQQWDDPDIVYRIAGDITVAAGATLTIGAGQTVKVRPFTGDDLIVAGTLIADGTEASLIIITSERDDTVGGDTNNNGATTGGNGDWNTITFNPTSTGNVMDNVQIRFGGTGSSAAVVDNGAPLTLTNSIIRHSATAGLRIVAGNPVITDVAFENNFGAAISMDLASNPVITNVTLTTNGVNALALDAGTLTGTRTWNNPGIVYRLSGDVTVAAGATLTIDAGQIVKARSFAADDLIVNGTLLVNGTTEQPVIFTSDRDDTAGGDTNNNGPTTGGNGDWNGILFNGGSTGNVLSHIDLRYAGTTNGGALVVTGAGASVTVQDSFIRNSASHALAARLSASLTAASNLLFKNSDTGIRAESGATVTAFNNTIDGNFRGVAADGAGTSVTLTNNLVTNNTNAGVFLSGGAAITASFNDVFNTTNYSGLANQTGLNGNISADPKYFNRANSQFGLRAGSPAVDSGTSTNAPVTDFFGNARFDDPNVLNLGGGSQTFFDMGAIERQEISTSDTDLRAVSVSGPATGLQGQLITVNWTVDNAGPAAVLGSWFDAVYLSADAIFTPDDLFLGETLHTGDLAPGASYAGSKQVTLPGVLPGDYYFIVRSNSKNEIFEAQALLNNSAASAQVVAMDLPTLTIGVPFNGTLPATGSALFYKINAPAGADLSVILDGPNSGFSNELYLSFATLPSRQSFDERGNRPALADQSVSVADTDPGQYYAMVYAANIPNAENFSLTASIAGFGITGISPARGSNTGNVTISITGSQFDANSQPRLIDSGGGTVLPTDVFFTDSGHLAATFDLTGHPAGAADVQVVNSGNVITTLPDSLNVVAGTEGHLVTSITSTGRVRLGRDFIAYLEYRNAGDTDLLAPIMRIVTNGQTELSLDPAMEDPTGTLQLIAINPNGPAGILPPGAVGRIPIYGRAIANGDEVLRVEIAAYPSTPIDYDAVELLMRPPDLTDAEWNPLFNQLQTQIGTSWAGYVAALSRDATLVTPAIGLNYSVTDAFRLEVESARAALNASVSGNLFLRDSAHPLAGATVFLVEQTTGKTFTTPALSDGSFLFARVAPGTYDVSVDGFALASPMVVTMAAFDVNDVDFVVNPAATISGGVLVAAGGAPLSNQLVAAVAPDGTSFTATTGADGTFTIPNVPAGTYTIQAGQGTFVQKLLPGIVVTAGAQLQHVNLALDIAGAISGTVNGPGGALSGVAISVFGPDGVAVGDGVLTSVGGTYTMGGLPAGTYTVQAAANNFAAARVFNVTVSAGATLTNLGFTLGAAGSATGTILAQTGATMLPGVLLIATQGGIAVGATSTDEEGHFTFSELAPGNYNVTAVLPGFVGTSFNFAITANQTATVPTVQLSTAGGVSGTATQLAGGATLEGLHVTLWSGGVAVNETTTDANGNYTIPDLDFGSYLVTIGSDAAGVLAASSIVLSGGTPSADVDFSLPIIGTIAGTVFASNGTTPIEGAVVTLFSGGVAIASTPTDADGNYQFYLSAAGSFSVQAVSDTSAYAAQAGLNITPGTNLDVDFTAGNSVVAGTIRDSGTGLPVPNGIIHVTGAGIIGTRAIEADANGHYEFTGPNGAQLTLVAHAGTRAFATAIVTLGGSPMTQDFSLTAGTALVGFVNSSVTGEAVQNAAVFIRKQGGPEEGFTTFTDEQGNYRVIGLAPGNYDVTVLAAGLESFVLNGFAVSGTEVPRNFNLNAPTITVGGTVQNGSGLPLPGVEISATNTQGLTIAFGQTDRNGVYALSNLPAGTYTLTATANGGAPMSLAPILVSAGNTVNGANFTVSPIAFRKDLTDPTQLQFSTLGSTTLFSGLLIPDDRSFIDRLLLRRPPTRLPDEPSAPTLPPGENCVSVIVAFREAQEAVRIRDLTFDNWTENYWAGRDVKQANAALITAQGLKFTGDLAKIYLSFQKVFYNVKLAGGLADVQKFVDRVNTLLIKGSDLAGKAVDAIRSGQPSVPSSGTLLDTVKFLSKAADELLNQLYDKDDLKNWGKFKDRLGLMTDVIGAIKDFAATKESVVKAIDDFSVVNGNTDIARDIYIKANVDAILRVEHFQWELAHCDEHDPKVKSPAEVPLPGFLGGPGIGGSSTNIAVRSSFDPNDKHGPAGYDDPATAGVNDGFIQPGAMPFEVEFENIGQIAAQIVIVTDLLDSDLDLTTFEFTGFGFSNREFTVPAGLTHFETLLDLRPDGIELLVPVTLDLNTSTRLVTVTFKTLDPLTMLAPDGFEGFLPPDNANHDGEGFFTYIVSPKATLGTGDVITNQATIVFDDNAPILTPTTTNTIDVNSPTSVVTTLPASTLNRTFEVSWTGSDTGSGIEQFALFVSVDNGPFNFHSNHTGLSTMFTGEREHTYAFYTIAGDNVGLAESAPVAADTTIEILPLPLITAVGNKVILTDSDGDIYTVKLTGPATAVLKYSTNDPDGAGALNGPLDSLVIENSTIKNSLVVTVKRKGDGPDIDKLPDGDGIVSIGKIAVTGALGAVNLVKSDITGLGFTATGTVKSFTIRDLAPTIGASEITIQGLVTDKTAVKARMIADNFTLSTPGILNSLVAADVGSGNIEAASIGKIQTTAGAFDADVTTSGAIGKITIKGGGLTGQLVAQRFGPIAITLGDFSGELTSTTPALTLDKLPALKSLKVSQGDLTGDIRVLGNIGAIQLAAKATQLGGNLTGASITAAKIASLIVAKNVANSVILAGADLGEDHSFGGTGGDADTFAAGSIGSVNIKGTVAGGIIGAGFSTTDSILKNGDDSITGGSASVIASLIVKGGADPGSYFAAGLFKKVPKFLGVAVDLNTDQRFLIG